MSDFQWTRDPEGRYRCEYGTIARKGSAWLVFLDPDLVEDFRERGYVADTLREAKKVADHRIRVWLERATLLAETNRRLTHYEQIMRRLEPAAIERYRREP